MRKLIITVTENKCDNENNTNGRRATKYLHRSLSNGSSDTNN